MFERMRLAVYVTLLDGSTKAEWYVVRESGSEGTDLVNDGFCDASKLLSELAVALSPLLSPRTAGR